MSCGYCFEDHRTGACGRCIREECVACCECGRVLRTVREETAPTDPRASGKKWGARIFDPPSEGCKGSVCGMWPCECQGRLTMNSEDKSVSITARRTRLRFDRSKNPWGTVRCETKEVSVVCSARMETRFGGEQQLTFGIDEGGVTGHERVYVDDRFIEGSLAHGWYACAGTPERWDELHLPADQIRLAFDAVGIKES